MCDVRVESPDLECEGGVELLDIGYWDWRTGGWGRREGVHLERRFRSKGLGAHHMKRIDINAVSEEDEMRDT